MGSGVPWSGRPGGEESGANRGDGDHHQDDRDTEEENGEGGTGHDDNAEEDTPEPLRAGLPPEGLSVAVGHHGHNTGGGGDDPAQDSVDDGAVLNGTKDDGQEAGDGGTGQEHARDGRDHAGTATEAAAYQDGQGNEIDTGGELAERPEAAQFLGADPSPCLDEGTANEKLGRGAAAERLKADSRPDCEEGPSRVPAQGWVI